MYGTLRPFFPRDVDTASREREPHMAILLQSLSGGWCAMLASARARLLAKRCRAIAFRRDMGRGIHSVSERHRRPFARLLAEALLRQRRTVCLALGSN